MTGTSYHYRECGLDNIYLANGYTLSETPYGETLAIHDVDKLHREIGRALARQAASLSGAGFRFLRVELGWSQEELSRLLGRDEQTIGRWERGESNVDPLADRILRLIFAEHTGNSAPAALTERLMTLSHQTTSQQTTGPHQMGEAGPWLFVEDLNGWQAQAA